MPSSHYRRLLIVDHDADIREVLVRFFSGSGFDVMDAPDGQTALDHLRRARFDAAILDMVLPGGIPGDAIAEAVAAAGGIVVMMSGSPEADERLDAVPYHYVRKPFRLSELLDAVEDALSHRDRSSPTAPGDSPARPA